MDKPVVSIVIPAYNSAKYIRETLDACLAQTHPNIEIIVIDDGSTDNTREIVATYDTVRLIQQANQGPAIARNRGISEAQSDYIQFCDSDDVLHPNKIERCLALLLENPASAIAYSQMQAVDERGIPIDNMPLVPDTAFFVADNLFCTILSANGSPIQTSTILARKSALMDVGMYRADPNYYCAEDWDLLLRLADKYDFVGIAEPLVKYRVREGALTTKPILMAEGRLKTIQYARHYRKRSQCFSDNAYDELEAGRHQVLAVKYWQNGENRLARKAFIKAIKQTSKGRLIRIVYALMTYLFPISAMHRLNAQLSH